MTNEQKMIIREMRAEKRTYKEIASSLGMSLNTVKSYCLRYGIKDTWSNTTITSILKNEKHKGDALMQKTVTVDFLQKKAKKNVGEAPQYYVEGNHPAIIDPKVFDLVQNEMERRKNN